MAEMKIDITDVIEKAIEKIEAEGYTVQKWIPCSEERPPFGKRVLGTTKAGQVVDVILCPQGCEWFRGGDFFPYNSIVAWMPLPKPFTLGSEANGCWISCAECANTKCKNRYVQEVKKDE